MLLHLYSSYSAATPIGKPDGDDRRRRQPNGHARGGGLPPPSAEVERQAQEFELEGLMSEEEDDEEVKGQGEASMTAAVNGRAR